MKNYNKILMIIWVVFCISVALIAIIFFPYRMEVFFVLLGTGSILTGIKVIIRKKVDPNAERTLPISQVDEHRMTRRNKWYCSRIPITFVLTGREAIMWGMASIVIGVGFILYSASFWLKIFVPTVLKALNLE